MDSMVEIVDLRELSVESVPGRVSERVPESVPESMSERVPESVTEWMAPLAGVGSRVGSGCDLELPFTALDLCLLAGVGSGVGSGCDRVVPSMV